MHSPFFQRLKDLEDNISKDLELLKLLEEELIYEMHPKRIMGYKRDIERQKKSLTNYQKEYTELQQQLANTTAPQIQIVENQLQQFDHKLQQINSKLNIVISSNVAINQNLNQMRQSLLNHYTAIEKSIINAITEQLNENQLTLTQNILDAIEANQISEPEIEQMLAVLEERLPSLPASQAPVIEILKSPELDARHKLKVTVPIIPFLIDYESELELASGLDIKTIWEQILMKLRRK